MTAGAPARPPSDGPSPPELDAAVLREPLRRALGLPTQDRPLVPEGQRFNRRPRDEEGLKDEQVRKQKEKVGELVLDIDILKEAMRGRPFGPVSYTHLTLPTNSRV